MRSRRDAGGDVRLTPSQVVVRDIGGMSEPSISYKRHRFPPETIAHAVWLYFRFPRSLRLVEEMLLERGVVGFLPDRPLLGR